MAYRISQPLAVTPLPGDGKKKKRVTKTKRVISEGATKSRGKHGKSKTGYVLTEKKKVVRGKDGKIKKEVTKLKNKSLAGGRKDLIKGKDVTRYKKDGTRVTRYKTNTMGTKTKGKETFKGVRRVAEKSKRVEPTKQDGYYTKKRQTTKTIKGTNKSLTKTTKRQNPRKTTTKRSYKRQD